MIGVSMFLITYNGYDNTDDWVTNLTGIFGIGLALCPCLYEVGTKISAGYLNLNPVISNLIHVTCASLFFLLLAYNSIFLFTKTNNKKSMSIKKKQRNIVYITCGIVMVVLMLLLVVLGIILGHETLNSEPIVFIIESFMLFAFGISWLVKGETIFRDKVNTANSNG
jgi:cytochrome bd-type quinol oxidase subunit 2